MRVSSLQRFDDRIEVAWDDGERSTFHYLWLRDNCGCPECRHPEAWERTLDTVAVPADVTPQQVTANEGLAIVWTDGHTTSLSAGWLRSNDYGPAARARRKHTPLTWTGASIGADVPEIEFDEVDAGDEGTLHWLRLIRDYGFSIVRNVPPQVGAVVDLAERIAFIQETNFGRSFQVISKPDPENLAYTSVKLNAHTDVPNRRGLPGLQFLHCIEFEADGGESILIDGYTAAARLRERHPEDHDLLAGVEIPFRFQDADNDIGNHYPVIGVDGDGDYTDIRFHTALMAPLDIDPELMVPYYTALRRFGEILRDPELEFVFKMEAGDCQVFDNRRVLHARAEFDPNTGPRHLQGCYVDRDDFMSRLRVLERHGADFRTS